MPGKKSPKKSSQAQKSLAKPRPERLTLKLLQHWDAKLAASGFQDIEYRDFSDLSSALPVFKVSGSSSSLRKTYNIETEQYYSNARTYYNHGTFESAFDRFVWFNHAEGASLRQVQKLLQGQRLQKPFDGLKPAVKLKQYKSVWYIRKTIIRLRQAMAEFQQRYPELFSD